MVIFLIGIIIVFIILNIFLLIKALNKSRRFNLTLYFIILIISIIFLKIYNKIEDKSSCKQWEIGLNGTNINRYNDSSECSIIIPKSCSMNAYFGLMDFSKYLNINCNNSNIKISHELLLKYLSIDNYYNFTNTKKFGYPNSNIFPTNKVRNSYHLNKNILSNIIDMDEKNEIAKNLNEDIKPEIILEFFNNYTEANISINVTYKKSLADKRRLKENKLSLYDNILFIFFILEVEFIFREVCQKLRNLLKNL